MANAPKGQEKARLRKSLEHLASCPTNALSGILAGLTHDDIAWWGPCPLDGLSGAEELIERFWKPIKRAFPDLTREDAIHVSGVFQDEAWTAAMGHFVGTFRESWLGFPPHGQRARLRFGEFHRIESDRIAETRLLIDLPDLAQQIGRPLLPRSRGEETLWPAPTAGDGLGMAWDEAETKRSADLVEALIDGLGSYDGSNLEGMGMRRLWTPDMLWYGPSGIGTTRGIDEFERHHQRPFLEAFPDRRGGHSHRARIADGPYVASTGWPSVEATHLGEYLGAPATGRRVGMRVMDFWRRKDALLHENWVLIDLPDLFRQFGIDLLARAAGEKAPAPKTDA